MINLFYDCYTILNKVYSEKAFVKQAINSTFIEEKNRSAIVKICYGVLDKDIELSYYISKIADKNPKLAVRTILKISMYSIKYLQKKPYAVTKNAVELTKKLGKGGASGFVNVFLRKFLNNNFALPTNLIERLSIKYSFPSFAVKMLIDDYGEDKIEEILCAEFPLNCLSFYDVDGEDYLMKKGIDYTKTPFENVFLVKNFTRNSDYDLGIYTYQALGSVAICNEIDSCEKLLDCCAAPGGKSVRLSYKCSEVYSWDIHEHRVELINEYAKRMNRTNVSAKVCDAKMEEKSLFQTFDAVLCDAPCSGFGVCGDNPDIKLNRTENDIAELNKEQLAILENVCKYVKKGGYLYYSTCSILNKENYLIVEQFLRKNKNFEIVNINSPLAHLDINGTNVFLPNLSFGAGFYLAKLKRVN